MTATTDITQLRTPRPPVAEPDQAVDLFTAKGFELAIRIGKAFATSNAVPAQFRNFTEKKEKGGAIVLVENPAALGNCIVAIETARAVGMSITAVMQQANIIEGKLSWSAQFVIGAINASGRFTPLRFDMKAKGPMKATYREKQGWNNEKRGFDFVDRTVEVDNVECIAWALPRNFACPPGIYTLKQARDANLPVIESAPVSMKMAVEEGWYAKPGSKWQTEMRTLMLQYRAGAFFGRIHAPDIVMGMGRTTEEVVDMQTIEVASDGAVTSVTTEQLRGDRKVQPAEVVNQVNAVGADDEPTGEVPPPPPPATAATPTPGPAFDAEGLAERMRAAKDRSSLDALGKELQAANVGEEVSAPLEELFLELLDALPAAPAPAPTSRRASRPAASME